MIQYQGTMENHIKTIITKKEGLETCLQSEKFRSLKSLKKYYDVRIKDLKDIIQS